MGDQKKNLQFPRTLTCVNNSSLQTGYLWYSTRNTAVTLLCIWSLESSSDFDIWRWKQNVLLGRVWWETKEELPEVLICRLRSTQDRAAAACFRKGWWHTFLSLTYRILNNVTSSKLPIPRNVDFYLKKLILRHYWTHIYTLINKKFSPFLAKFNRFWPFWCLILKNVNIPGFFS